MDMKRFFLYFIVIAALALAGCGGNGGTAMMPPDPPDPTPDPCPTGQTRDAQGNCVTPPPTRTPPSAELVAGIVDLQVWAGVDGDRHDGFDGPNRYLPFSALADDSVIRSMSVAVTAASAGATRRLAQTLSLRNAR